MEYPLHGHLHDYQKAEDSTGRFRHMYNVMAKNHAPQKRKLTGEQYIAHTKGVEEIVHLVTDDEDTRLGALGHDLVEDTTMTLEKMAEKFGDRVAFIVWGVTKDDTIPGWHERNEANLDRLEHEAEDGSVIVALADKIYNITDMIENHFAYGNAMWERFKAQPADQLWWYQSVLAIGEKRVPNCELNGYLRELIEIFRSEVVMTQPENRFETTIPPVAA